MLKKVYLCKKYIVMKRIIIVALFLSIVLACHAQDTVHFTEFQWDTHLYHHSNEYNDLHSLDRQRALGYTGQVSTNSFMHFYRQRCNHPIMVYGVAVAFLEDPDSSIRACIAQMNPTPIAYWSFIHDNSFFIIDSTGRHYTTRYYHTTKRAFFNDSTGFSNNCQDSIIGTVDTTVLCYEYWFPHSILVDSDFYLGVYLHSIHYYPPEVFYRVYREDLCENTDISLRPYHLSYHNDGRLYNYPDYTGALKKDYILYPIIRAITSPLLVPVDSVPVCGGVDNLRTTVDDWGRITLEWNPVPCAERYEIAYGLENFSMDTTVITSATTLQIAGLNPGSMGYARVRPRCHHICLVHDTTYYGPWSNNVTFEVPRDTTPCPTVLGLTATWVDTDCVRVAWTPVDDNSSFQLNYAEADSLFDSGMFINCPHSYIIICGLQTDKAYKLRVRVPCSSDMAVDGYGPWSDTLLFNPQPTSIADVMQGGIRIRPNPTRDRLTVERPNAGPATLEVFNAKG